MIITNSSGIYGSQCFITWNEQSDFLYINGCIISQLKEGCKGASLISLREESGDGGEIVVGAVFVGIAIINGGYFNGRRQ